MSALSRTVLLAAVLGAGACRTAAQPASAPVVQPGAPGEPTRTVARSAAAASPSFTRADVKFMQGMIHHHAQAIEMVELLKTRTSSDDMRKLAERIELSQADEMKMMGSWLESHGQEVPATGEHAQHMGAAPMMPGMLSPQQMAQLAAATGSAFDRLFLELMIQHHAGALTMVKDLFATAGAAQDSDVFAFASDVDADQRMEIARMTTMLKELQK